MVLLLKKLFLHKFLFVLFLFTSFSNTVFLLSQELSKNTRPPHFVNRVDNFGRNYRLKWNGDIFFSLDDSYQEAFPDSSQLDVHIAEAKILSEKRKFIPAIRLLKGITLCNRLNQKKNKKANDMQKLLNRLLSENQDRLNELAILTEPYGCYSVNKKNENKLFIESKDFAFFYEIDPRFRYIFPNDIYRFARSETDYNWKVSYFSILLPGNSTEESFESEYLKYESQIFYEPPSKIIFSIGQTFHKSSILFPSHYSDVWDGRRGLSNSIKKSIEFSRIETKPSFFETNFNLNLRSKKQSFAGFETYRFKNNRGIGTFLTCPKEVKMECSKIWEEISNP